MKTLAQIELEKRVKELEDNIKLLLIGIKEGDIIIFPSEGCVIPYIDILERLVK